MKYLLIIIIIYNCNSEKKIRQEDDGFLEKSGILYYEGEFFTGEVYSKYPNGVRKISIHYKNGLKHGKEYVYYPNGNPVHERNYLLGKKEGTHYGWHENGEIRFQTNFIADRFEGENFSWYPGGRLESYMKFKDGKLLGHKQWRMDGMIYMNYVMNDFDRIGLYGAKLCRKVGEEK
jgi:antitoxin component YwqK of YwqJK toxin-antitoxin module